MQLTIQWYPRVVNILWRAECRCGKFPAVYLDSGEFDHYLFLNRCPDMVVDTAVVAKALVALLVAGMGDAMATYFEARACRASGSDNQTAGKPTRAATGLAA